RKTFFEFVRLHTSHNASHFEMLGKTVIEDIVWDIDAKLAEYSNQFNFLFLVTPVNLDEAWDSFSKSGFRKNPVFHYRPMPIDPELIKRKLYNLPVEDISDPTIAFLFRDKRKEIDRMLNMMAEREKPDFMHSSLQVFGGVDENLAETARAILVATPLPPESKKKDLLPAAKFASMARSELRYLRKQYPDVSPEVYIREDIEGILVSKGVLWISNDFRVSRERANGLIQHEVGTHISTYYNGKAQPFRLFYTGVPGYEQLQEGLAVLAEYIMDGLTNQRLRTLAGRVLAVHHMIAGHSFVETFDLLQEKYRFSARSSFSTTMRVYRGGGLTKDAVYLKGFLNLLEYIRKGNELEP
ncbi:MAG TPA: tyrosine/phenylalanine carboxypeptidase domain-containing protein, partial [Anseongella sp.]|nr:tyrosine/phenylalanine carboxypeptidase domain-containing protein [Anseongella sp.]